MKRKENLSLKRRNLVVVLLAYVLVISSMLTACGTSTATTAPETKQEVAAVDKEEVQSEVANKVETESVTEGVEETEVATYEKAITWAKKVKEEEPKLTIWNSVTKHGLVLENAQKYLVKEGDILVLCGDFEGSVYTEINTSILKQILSTSIHTEYEFSEIPAGETDISILLEVNEEEYELSLIVVSENATATTADVSESTEVSGKDWANSLEYEEPKLVAWNDATGTKEVIEQGGKYVMQQGDILGVYYPTGYFVVTALPYDFFESFTVLSKVCIMDCKLPSESQDINLEVEVLNEQSESGIYNYVITTP